MQFNPDPNKQVQEVYFSTKSNHENSLPVTYNNVKVVTCSTHKHLGLLLNKRLSFNEHIQSKMNKCYKMIRVIKRSSREHLYHEVGLESLGDRRWYRKLTFFNKIVNGLAPKYLANYLNINDNQVYKTRASEQDNIKRYGARTENVNHFFLLKNGVN